MSEHGEVSGTDGLFADWSTDIGGRDVLGLEPARRFISPATRVYVGFLGSEDFAMRVNALSDRGAGAPAAAR